MLSRRMAAASRKRLRSAFQRSDELGGVPQRCAPAVCPTGESFGTALIVCTGSEGWYTKRISNPRRPTHTHTLASCLQGEAVAVKKCDSLGARHANEEFAREAYIMSSCRHPNIAEIFGEGSATCVLEGSTGRPGIVAGSRD